MGLKAYVAPVSTNKYAGEVEELLAAGEGNSWELTVPTDKAVYERQQWQKAANAVDKTAKVVSESADAKTGQTTIEFILVTKYAPKTPKTKDETPDDEVIPAEGE